jgi:glycerophosphoryl diester phosphodiesterase
MNFDIRTAASDHLFVVCHRGVTGGNIPCNTMPAYQIALQQGADMLETDVSTTADGKLVIFHPRMEQRQLGVDCDISTMPWEEVRQLRYTNADNIPTQFGLLTLDEFLEEFKGKCFVNIDKFWGNPAGIYNCVKRHGMIDQVLVKSRVTEEVMRVLEEIGPEIPFMPVVYETAHDHEMLLKRNINYVGVEVVFENEDNHLASPDFIQKMQADGKLVWVNSLIYNTAKQLSGGHSDDTAFTISPDYGWGWLADRSFDIIQTDWPDMLIDYLKRTGRYYK